MTPTIFLPYMLKRITAKRVTKYKIPAYMGSSFAYIAAMQTLMKTDGIAAVAQGSNKSP